MESNENKNNMIIEVKEEDQRHSNDSNKQSEKTYGGFGCLVGRIFKFIGMLIKKGSENFFEIKKDDEKPIRISLIISILLFVVLTVPTFILLVIGLFCGYRYSIVGKNIKCDGVNNVFEKASKSADDIKNDFKEGYEK